MPKLHPHESHPKEQKTEIAKVADKNVQKTEQNDQMVPKVSDIKALQLNGFYLSKKIGKGAFATVYEATFVDQKSGRKSRLACKIVNKAKTPQDFLSKFFQRELDILMKVEHRFLIQTHTILERNAKVFIFMSLASNGDILAYVQNYGAVNDNLARIWFYQMIKGLDYLHSLNIAHRDLKCENVLLSKNYNVKLADFGFARYCSDRVGNRILSETFCGSTSYVSPEIVSGIPYNAKIADIWSCGVVLFVILNSSMPFDDSNMKKLLKDQCNRNYKYNGKVADSISEEAKCTVNCLLEPDALKRPNTTQILMFDWLQKP